MKNKFSYSKFLFQNKKQNQKGQGLIEVLILSPVLIILFQFILLVFWIGVNVLWMEHQLYQGILCVAQKKDIQLCKMKVTQQIKRFNTVENIQSVKINHFNNEWKGEIIWNIYKKKFFIQQNLHLP